MHKVKVGNFQISNDLPFVLIAGPCQMESEIHALKTAETLQKIAKELNVHFIYKTSFDKANRTSISSKRGIGLKNGLEIFSKIKAEIGCPVLTDIHTAEHCDVVAEVVDVLQIPAFLCRQTDLLISAGKTKKAINVKKGQFLAPWDMKHVATKIASTGNENIMLCERGVTFGYNRLINDMRALPIMASTGYPVVFDATHSVQEPSAIGNESGGQREFIKILARAAIAVGVAAIFIETHEDPDNAPSDGPCMLPLNQMKSLLEELIKIDTIIKR
ncbi:3-deoxy-8-phosphooctulonate synthase [Rickettsiales endosymbiont of Peranema trichophorum]|uniref:3-deoxy-8-phosphooctulonate synthase n=1 Tax=Rickettsiales endosymbiont of Peranema trichophorum TaxID=2486577 RepID=UPI0010238EC4|nr:3-deoxy-8-phosphooctulonate synthase [Rickettsiales endosymbiont of Peranema trichophorum]RZI46002.1 3-deoxy-8-phosphooctulonate synthase [Rickettsiales endosymbiont of Peranema trichophorum]